MCSLQDAFPNLDFTGQNNLTKDKLNNKTSKANDELFKMQEERGMMINSTHTDMPYQLLNKPNTPPIINTNVPGGIPKPNTVPEIKEETFNTNERTVAYNAIEISVSEYDKLMKKIDNLSNEINKIKKQYKNRNIHDLILFVIILTFIALIIDTLFMKK